MCSATSGSITGWSPWYASRSAADIAAVKPLGVQVVDDDLMTCAVQSVGHASAMAWVKLSGSG